MKNIRNIWDILIKDKRFLYYLRKEKLTTEDIKRVEKIIKKLLI